MVQESTKYGLTCNFSEKGQKKGQKRAKYLKIWAKTYKIWKCFEKGQPHACDYRMHETARICPECHVELIRLVFFPTQENIFRKTKWVLSVCFLPSLKVLHGLKVLAPNFSIVFAMTSARLKAKPFQPSSCIYIHDETCFVNI